MSRVRLEKLERIRPEVVEILPQAYMDCYELCLALGEREIADIFAGQGRQLSEVVRGKESLWSRLKL